MDLPLWLNDVLAVLENLEQHARGYDLHANVWSSIVLLASLYRDWQAGEVPPASKWPQLRP